MSENFSAELAIFLNYIRAVPTQYKLAKEEYDKQEALTQDYLHSLELDTLTYKQRCKIATKLTKNRKNRRKAKDNLEVLTPLYNYITDPVNKRVFDKLTDVLGDTRKVEKYHSNRHYVPRVLNGDKKNDT